MGNTLVAEDDLRKVREVLDSIGDERLTMSDEQLTMSLTETAAEYEMTLPQLVQYIVTGAPRHPDAPENHCGIADPRDNGKWCVRRPDHVSPEDDTHCSNPLWEGA